MERIIFSLLVFLAPTQLAYHFWPSFAYIFGIRVDHLAPAIYLTDILVVMLLGLWLVKGNARKLKTPFFLTLASFAAFAILNIAFAESIYPALFKWIKVFEFLFLGLYVATTKVLDLKTWIIKPLAFSLIVFSLIGIAQFVIGRTIGGPLYFLGERTFSKEIPGIALVASGGREFLRAYSTFSHPNSMAGYLLVGAILVLGYELQSRLSKFSLLISFLALILTFSLSIFITALIVGIVYVLFRLNSDFAKKGTYILLIAAILSSFVFMFSSQKIENADVAETISQRGELSQKAFDTIRQNPLFGVGLNNFLIVSRSLQPVHNIFLLVLSETGIIGFLLFLYLIINSFKNLLEIGKNNRLSRWKLVIPILVVLITGLVDHYWLTLQQNQLLLSIIFGLSFRQKL